ncbi:hypothetical protein [Paracoccus sp. N5]|nr:hypothetical protein [Paracoccus sp. N5]
MEIEDFARMRLVQAPQIADRFVKELVGQGNGRAQSFHHRHGP